MSIDTPETDDREVRISYRNDEGATIRGVISMREDEFVDFINLWADDTTWED